MSQIVRKTFMAESEEDFDIICDLCIKEGKRMEAVVYCLNCEEYLCTECNSFHKKSSALVSHTLQDKATMSTPPQGRKQLSGASVDVDPLTDMCQKHPKKHIKFYCNLHHQLGCSVCVPLHHRTCGDNVSYIPAISSSTASSAELKRICGDTKRLIAQLEVSKSRSEWCQQETNDSFDQAVAEVKKFRLDINQVLDKLEESLLNEASRQRKECLNSLTRQAPKFDDLIKEVKKICFDLDRKEELKHLNQLFISMKYAKEKFLSLEKEATSISQTIKLQRVAFKRHAKLDSLTSSLNHLGTLSQVDQPKAAKFLNDINVKTSTDTNDCCICGVVVLKDGRLAMADYNNKCVKIVDMTDRNKYEKVTFTSSPTNITMIGDDQLAVTLALTNRILLISLSPTLSAGRTITGPGRWYNDLTYNRGKLFLTSDDPVHCVYICDMSGNLIQQIDSDNTGNKLFECPTGITTSPDGSIVYVSDERSHEIVCLNCEGVVMATYGNDLLWGLWGLRGRRRITVDQHGCLYVCWYNSDNVIQLSPSGQLGNIVIKKKDGILDPWAITYNTRRLYISSKSDKSDYRNNIKVYKLE